MTELVLSADYISTEHANMIDPDNWGTSSAWAEVVTSINLLKFGAADILDMRVGSSPVLEIRLGSVVVWKP